MCDSPAYCVYNARWLKTVTNNYKDLIEWAKPLHPPLHEWLGSKRLWPAGSRILSGVFESSRFIRQSYSASAFLLKLHWCSAIRSHQLPGMFMFLLGFVCYVACTELLIKALECGIPFASDLFCISRMVSSCLRIIIVLGFFFLGNLGFR